MTVTYTIGGTLFSAFGVIVSQSKGILNALKMREPSKTIWQEHHGEAIDLAEPRYEAREITLECIIKAANSNAFILAMTGFVAQFRQQGLQQLVIQVDDGSTTLYPLVFMVYLSSMPDVTKTWSDANMVGTFSITLREPEPVKKVYKPGSTSESVTITSDYPVNIYWGDGAYNLDVTTDTGTLSHSYIVNNNFYIVITGVIGNISGISTGATEIW